MKITIWFISLFFCFAAFAGIETNLKKIVSSFRIPQERLGLYVVDLTASNHPVLLNVNGEKNYIPASLSKVFTASAVLQKLGSSAKFQTELLSDAPREGDVLKGALYLKGGGDPGFVSETM